MVNRRKFLKWLGIGTSGAVVAPAVLIKMTPTAPSAIEFDAADMSWPELDIVEPDAAIYEDGSIEVRDDYGTYDAFKAHIMDHGDNIDQAKIRMILVDDYKPNAAHTYEQIRNYEISGAGYKQNGRMAKPASWKGGWIVSWPVFNVNVTMIGCYAILITTTGRDYIPLTWCRIGHQFTPNGGDLTLALPSPLIRLE